MAKKIGSRKVAIASSEDKEVLLALEQARREGVIERILVGIKEKPKEASESEQNRVLF